MGFSYEHAHSNAIIDGRTQSGQGRALFRSWWYFNVVQFTRGHGVIEAAISEELCITCMNILLSTTSIMMTTKLCNHPYSAVIRKCFFPFSSRVVQPWPHLFWHPHCRWRLHCCAPPPGVRDEQSSGWLLWDTPLQDICIHWWAYDYLWPGLCPTGWSESGQGGWDWSW